MECCKRDCCIYDLSDLGKIFGLEESVGDHYESALYCKSLIQKVWKKDDVDIEIESPLPGLENSTNSELVCSKCQIPDLYLARMKI